MFAVNVMTVAQVVVLVDGLTVADAIVTIVIGFIAPIVFFLLLLLLLTYDQRKQDVAKQNNNTS